MIYVTGLRWWGSVVFVLCLLRKFLLDCGSTSTSFCASGSSGWTGCWSSVALGKQRFSRIVHRLISDQTHLSGLQTGTSSEATAGSSRRIGTWDRLIELERSRCLKSHETFAGKWRMVLEKDKVDQVCCFCFFNQTSVMFHFCVCRPICPWGSKKQTKTWKVRLFAPLNQ